MARSHDFVGDPGRHGALPIRVLHCHQLFPPNTKVKRRLAIDAPGGGVLREKGGWLAKVGLVLLEPEKADVTIVLLGHFNPRIFTPDWFARNEMISAEEAEAARLDIVHPSVSQFQTDWFTLMVDEDRFQISTTQVPYINLHDLVMKVFRERLYHTPVGKMGINREVHVNVGSVKARDKIGYSLAPPDLWGPWAREMRVGKEGRHGGLRSLTMQLQVNFDDRPRGQINATVQPSNKIQENQGIFVHVNDHYEAEDTERPNGAEEIMKMLEASFDKSIHRSDEIIDQILRLKDV